MNSMRTIGAAFVVLAAGSVTVLPYPASGRPGAVGSPPPLVTAERPAPQVSDDTLVRQVLDLVERQYVEPGRVEYKDFAAAALTSLEKQYPEVIVDLRADGMEAVLRIGDGEKTFDLSGLESLSSTAAVLGEALEYTSARIGGGEDDGPRYTALRGGLRTLDPHTQLFDRRQMGEFQTKTRGFFGGVGFSFSLAENGILINSIMDGTPAEKVGLLTGDVITAVDGSPTAGITTDETVALVRGDPGTKVVLTVSREGWPGPREITPVRAVIRSRSVRAEVLADEGETPVDYIRIERFQGETSMQIQEALDGAAEGAAGVILDLRGNPGGLLDQALASTDLFLDDGVIVTTRDRSGRSRSHRASMFGVVRNQLPMVVLINRASASAAEVMAAALKDTRAVVLGETSFGKGSVQQMYPLADGGGLLLTIRHYFTPGEVSIQSRGVDPDVLLQAVVVGKKMILGEPVAHRMEGSLQNAFGPRGDGPGSDTDPEWKVEFLREGLPELGGNSFPGKAGGHDPARNDAAVRVAEAILRQAAADGAGGTRADLLKATVTVLDSVSDQEAKRITGALAEQGIEWAGAGEVTGETALLEAELPAEIVLTGGETTTVTLRIRNAGSKPAYRVWGRTVSANPLLANHDFVFGTVPPGDSREATVEMAIPSHAWRRWDTYELALREGDGRDAGHFRGSARSMPNERPELSYTLELSDVNTEDPERSGDGILAAGERLSLTIRTAGDGGDGPLKLRVSSETEGGLRLDRRHETFDLPANNGNVTFRTTLIEPGEAESLELKISFRREGVGTILEDLIAVPVGSPYRASENRRPPRVETVSVPPEKTGSGRFVLEFTVSDETSVKDVYVLLAGKKILYRQGDGVDPVSLPVTLEVDLADGSNRIDVVARDGDNLVTEKSFFVFRLPQEG